MCLSLAMGLSIPLEPGIPKIYGLPPRSYITKIQNIGGRESEREGERESVRGSLHMNISYCQEERGGPISITGEAQHVAC